MNTSNKTVAPAVETTAQVTVPSSNAALSISDFLGLQPTQLFALFSKLSDKAYVTKLASEINSLEEMEAKFNEILKELNIEFDKAALIAKIEVAGIQFLESVAMFIQTFAGQAIADQFRETCMKAVVTFKMTKGNPEEAFIAAVSTIELWGFSGKDVIAKHKAKQEQLEIIASATPANEEVKVADDAASAIAQAFTFG